MVSYEKRIELLKNEDVKQVLYDLMHKRKLWEPTPSGQHYEFKEMITELEKDYEKQVNKQIDI